MRSSLGLGKILGIEINIHFSWLFVLALVIWSLAFGYFPQQFPTWSTTTYWLVATIAALLLFASVLVHELSHSFVAMRRGMPVEGITLFIFGGVSNIGEEAKRPSDELLMSIVGPLSSFGIAIASGALLFATRGWSQQLSAVLIYLMMVNVLLGAFNLVPGFPLDGGRVLRAIIWAVIKNQYLATRIASFIGQGIAYLFIFGGLFVAFGGTFFGFQGDLLSGIWLVLIGWFLANAASSSLRQAASDERFRGLTVAQLMNPHPLTVSPDATIQQLVNDYVLRYNVRAIPVVREDRLIGIITLSDIRNVPSERWSTLTVGEMMGGRKGLRTVSPEDSLSDAMQSLDDGELNQLPVVREGHLVGLLTRNNLLGYVEIRDELGHRS